VPETRWKGFDLADLRAFGLKQTAAGVEIPYFTRKGKHWRSKVFKPNGDTYWLGKSKAQIPYGLETLNLGGPAVVLTEGESDALALRLAFPKLPVLGIPGASSWKAEWTTCLDDFLSIYLSFDADKAGEKLTCSVQASLPFVVALRLPESADTRDVIQQLGKGAFKVLVEEARASAEVTAAHRALERVAKRRLVIDETWERQRRAAA
jgi:hypothetical protein